MTAMRGYSKRIKRLMNEWASEAHERELRRELLRLDESLDEWRQEQIGSGEMSYRVHEWDRGPARALFRFYNDADKTVVVAYAITAGILDEDEVPAELVQAILGTINVMQEAKDRGTLQDRSDGWWRD